MSRWWGSEIRIALCADRLIVVRLVKRGGARVVDKALLAVEQVSEGPIWSAPVRALAEYLKAKAPGSAPVTVVLSNRFARYTLVPWYPELLSHAERLALTRHRFKEQYGEIARKWNVELSRGAYGDSAVACALDGELVKGVRLAAEQAGAKLISVQPYLVAAFNQFRSELATKSETRCFATVEPDTLCLAWFHNGQWQGVKTRRPHRECGQELRAALLEEVGGSALDAFPSVAHVFAPERNEPIALDVALRVNRLRLPAREGFSAVTDARFAMGLCGVA